MRIRVGTVVQLANNHRRKRAAKVLKIFWNGRLALLDGKLGEFCIRNVSDLERAGQRPLNRAGVR